jgi:hypothetical protein
VQESNHELPEAQAIDRWITIFRALAAGIPLAGGSITELWNGFFCSPLAKRREAWLRGLAKAVVELQKAMPDLSLESLQQNEAFISAVLGASSIAMRNHRKEKLEALRNAAISSVVHPDIDEDLQAMFMRYVDELTPWHLRLLRAFHDPNAHFRKIGSNVEWLVKRGETWWSSSKEVFLFVSGAFPELQSEHQFVGQLVYDLGVRQLIPVQQLFHQKLPDVGPYTTFTGQKFMRFVG